MQGDLLNWREPERVSVAREPTDRPTIEQRWAEWARANQHVLAELLRLARSHLTAGVTYLSVKKLWEECRASLRATRESGYQLNNDFTASAGRWLIEQEPRLVGVMRTRRTKHQ